MTKYGLKAQEKIGTAIHQMHEGKLKSDSFGKKVTNHKQAIAFALSEARNQSIEVINRKETS